MARVKYAIVLGATSLVGPFLCERLAAGGYRGECITRKPTSNDIGTPSAFRWRRLDVRDPGDWHGPKDAVVFSLLPIWVLPPLLSRLKEARQIVAVSTTSIFSKAASRDPRERALAVRIDAAEREVERICADTGLFWTILRPTLIYEPRRDLNISRIATFIERFGFFPVAYPARGLRQPVHADDVAQAAVSAVDNPRAVNAAFNLPGAETLAYREMVRRVFEGMGRRPVVVSLPGALLSLAVHLVRLAYRTPYSPALFERMNQDLVFDGAAARAALAYDPRPFRPHFRAVPPEERNRHIDSQLQGNSGMVTDDD